MIIKPNPWWMAAIGGGNTTEITVGARSEGEARGYMAKEFTDYVGGESFGSISNPELFYALIWYNTELTEEGYSINQVWSSTNVGRITFPTYAGNYIDLNELTDLSSALPALAPIYVSTTSYYMGGAKLPMTPGSKLPYVYTT